METKKWSDNPDVNPKTGIAYYRGGYFKFMREKNLLWWVIAAFLFWILPCLQHFHQEGNIGYAHILIFAPVIALYYVYHNWREQQKGQTS